MERKILLKQNRQLGIKEGVDPKPRYINEEQQYKALKNNIILLLSILGICLFIRLNTDKVSSSMGDNAKRYYDVPSNTTVSHAELLQIA